jgi:hypothetical protein
VGHRPPVADAVFGANEDHAAPLTDAARTQEVELAGDRLPRQAQMQSQGGAIPGPSSGVTGGDLGSGRPLSIVVADLRRFASGSCWERYGLKPWIEGATLTCRGLREDERRSCRTAADVALTNH